MLLLFFCSATSLSVEWYRGGKKGKAAVTKLKLFHGTNDANRRRLIGLYNGGELQPCNVCHSEPIATATK